MIFVTAYPGTYAVECAASARPPLAELAACLDALAPREVGVYLLPFHPSDGDGGFAPGDWYAVDRAYGTSAHVRRLAATRRLVLDGVYNHVGVSHPLARAFFAEPRRHAHLVHAYRRDTPRFELPSPRGGSAVRGHVLDGEVWQVWQTFGPAAVDIRLDDPSVRAEVVSHLEHLAATGSWGVRLDAAAYYAKPSRAGEAQLHHRDARRLVRELASLARGHGLEVLVQLDCDDAGMRYFPDAADDVTMVDYGYSPQLALALLSSDARRLAAHLAHTTRLGVRVARAPRTHDGIMLRSRLLDPEARSALVDVAARFGIPVRKVEGEPYELNCALPDLLHRGTTPEGRWRRIEIAVAVSAFVSEWCFLYLPMLLDFVPDVDAEADGDPRSSNRQPMPARVWRELAASERGESLRRLLAGLVRVHARSRGRVDARVAAPEAFGGRVLTVDRRFERVLLVANLDLGRPVDVGGLVRGKLSSAWRASPTTLGPLGFGFWEY